MDNLIELDRRISRAIDRGKGIQLSDEDLDLLASTGAVNVLKNAAAEASRGSKTVANVPSARPIRAGDCSVRSAAGFFGTRARQALGCKHRRGLQAAAVRRA